MNPGFETMGDFIPTMREPSSWLYQDTETDMIDQDDEEEVEEGESPVSPEIIETIPEIYNNNKGTETYDVTNYNQLTYSIAIAILVLVIVLIISQSIAFIILYLPMRSRAPQTKPVYLSSEVSPMA